VCCHRGLNDIQLDTPYREGGWTARQVVHHVADQVTPTLIFASRLALTEIWPTIKPYDQAAWANLADSRGLPIGGSLAIIKGLHERWVALLESLSEEDFHKGYNHPESGGKPWQRCWLCHAWHARHHTAHIAGLRASQGW